MTYVRLCPRCGSVRPAAEYVCQGSVGGQPCGWSLYDVLPVPAGTLPAGSEPSPLTPPDPVPPGELGEARELCRGGHPLEPGEFMCMVCGAPAADEPSPAPAGTDVETAPRVVNGWRLGAALPATDVQAELFLARRDPGPADDGDPSPALFKHYQSGVEPPEALYPALRSLGAEHGTRLLDAGRWEARAFEVWEHLPLGALDTVPWKEKAAPDFVRATVREVGLALHGLERLHLIHRDLQPANVLLRARAPLQLVLTGFGAAVRGEFDLQSTGTRPPNRYAAPETIAGACSGASDWWSLGVILLEMLTRGRGFEGMHVQAFLLHLVTRGLRVPADLPEEWRELLMGLLTRDPARRWGWAEVTRWLEGERGIPHGYAADDGEGAGAGAGSLRLGGRSWPTPESFALAAAEAQNWDEARGLLLGGGLATWLQTRGGQRDLARAAHVRRLAADLTLAEDARLAAALLTLNDNLPLCHRGEIVTPVWLLAHPDVALTWLDGPLLEVLRRLEREGWLVRLRERADRVRARVRATGLAWDDVQLSAALLATSRPMLETRWRERRGLFPESDQRTLAAALERRTPTEEDLILLVSAPLDLFRPAADVLDEAEREAQRAPAPWEHEAARRWLESSRREILDALDERLRGFVRCGRPTADGWADDFRQERRLPLARALALLAIPAPEWREPPRQEYVRNVLEFCRRRLAAGLQRGALVRMTIGKTTARLDLSELGGPVRPAEALLAAVLARGDEPVTLDPAPLTADPRREGRLRRLNQTATAYRRDTGINALYLGFPFVMLRDARADEPARGRLAPVLLWPVRLETPLGANRAFRLAFDAERAEVRLNPALEGLLGDVAPAWRAALDDLRGRDHLDLSAVQDALIPLAPLADPAGAGAAARLQPLPSATGRAAAGATQLHASAVLFLCDFSGQTIARDLEKLASQPIQGTALAVAIRADLAPPPTPVAQGPVETDRYFTAAADPSQQAAVFRARQAPGLVVQGPPGTGKSQTIVNIVGDALGRGERVLVVCQKPAALEVVRKRLEAEGLGERLFLLRDAVSDRLPLLRALRAQLDQPRRLANDDALLRQERLGLARHVETLEDELDRAHVALREARPDGPGGLSYRALLEGLLEAERGPRPPVSCASLGADLRPLDHATVEALGAALAPLAPLWLAARYEDSALHSLAHFRTDEATAEEFRGVLVALREAETCRDELLRRHERFFDLARSEPLQRWLAEHENALRALPSAVTQSLARHADLFTPSAEEKSPLAEQIIPWLEHLADRLRALDAWTLAAPLYERLAGCALTPLQTLAQEAGRPAVPPRSWLAKLNPGRWLARRRVTQWLHAAGVEPGGVDLAALRGAAELEAELREQRSALHQWRETLEDAGSTETPPALPAVRAAVHRLLERLRPAAAAARRVQACPVQAAAQALCLGGDASACAAVLDVCRASLALWAATRQSEACLERAAAWFDPTWVAERRRAITERAPGAGALEALAAALPTLAAFQTFRLRAKALDPTALPLLARLRAREDTWRGVPAAELPAEVARTLRREALLSWKAVAEEACPALLMERAEAEQKVRLLGEKDAALRQANRRLLAHCAAAAPVAARGAWDDVAMLTGPRARRLREVVERGDGLGLFQLRPVWLVNPEMVSRVFPLRAGLFDLVIFDEASQLPVEGSLPALFRARRVVVSGDEKQMPPSRFFGSQLDSDEDEQSDEETATDDDTLDEEARERLAQATGRREVKDCPDLLSLTQNLLPTATLEIHYRSKYRQLIDFSNAAFYGGRLSVPARHPAAEVRRVRPIEVDRVDGDYVNQTNPAEAARIVECLGKLWLEAPPQARPSIGVVTFNLKQAELIQDALQAQATRDEAFRAAWETEQARTQRGEDMGFFVKNLENVQGDERDWIIFSTTFGRDAAGAFRRNFGVLGQRGGERRLNVAVTRAREKVLLVTSLPVPEVAAWTTGAASHRPPTAPRDFLQGWLAYSERLDAGKLDAAQSLLLALRGGETSPHAAERPRPEGNPPSPFADEVAAFLRGLGQEPVQAGGDAFGVDFALVDARTGLFGLGIECDAPSHPALVAARARELWRPAVLAASLPRLHRVRSRDWYHERASEQARLRAAVHAALGDTGEAPDF